MNLSKTVKFQALSQLIHWTAPGSHTLAALMELKGGKKNAAYAMYKTKQQAVLPSNK